MKARGSCFRTFGEKLEHGVYMEGREQEIKYEIAEGKVMQGFAGHIVFGFYSE